MKATVLIDNLAGNSLHAEWGLSIHVETDSANILLDAGTTGAFADNADRLGIDLSNVDFGVLSHAHYDHADGMKAFFERNSRAPLYLRAGSGEDCWSRSGKRFGMKYIGIRKGFLEAHADRICPVEGDFSPCPGVWLIPHKSGDLTKVGKHAGMYRRRGLFWKPDNFSHEQSLVIETAGGLVVFNSCSHGGADRILTEVADTFPGKKIAAMIGGFHLFRSSEEEILAFARRVRDTGVEKLITGHCTGDEAFALLKAELGEKIEQFSSGYRIEV